MKVSKSIDEKKFLNILETCTGKVELLTKEGDRLNLKSKLSQYVFLAGILRNSDMQDFEIVAYEKEDIEKIALLFAEKGK